MIMGMMSSLERPPVVGSHPIWFLQPEKGKANATAHLAPDRPGPMERQLIRANSSRQSLRPKDQPAPLLTKSTSV
jgi:hypothetical protein